jgi:hypothetical protein
MTTRQPSPVDEVTTSRPALRLLQYAWGRRRLARMESKSAAATLAHISARNSLSGDGIDFLVRDSELWIVDTPSRHLGTRSDVRVASPAKTSISS